MLSIFSRNFLKKSFKIGTKSLTRESSYYPIDEHVFGLTDEQIQVS